MSAPAVAKLSPSKWAPGLHRSDIRVPKLAHCPPPGEVALAPRKPYFAMDRGQTPQNVKTIRPNGPVAPPTALGLRGAGSDPNVE
jgi:hypothetical protein